MQPVPSKRALLRWFRQIGLSKIKANPAAHRGGGAVYFHRGAVERALKSRLGSGYKDGTEAGVGSGVGKDPLYAVAVPSMRAEKNRKTFQPLGASVVLDVSTKGGSQ